MLGYGLYVSLVGKYLLTVICISKTLYNIHLFRTVGSECQGFYTFSYISSTVHTKLDYRSTPMTPVYHF